MRNSINRRTLLATIASGYFLGTAGASLADPELPDVAAFRNPGCSCCENWAKLMKDAGFKITMSDDPDLAGDANRLAFRNRLPAAIWLRLVDTSLRDMSR
jgi:hypothetical protein